MFLNMFLIEGYSRSYGVLYLEFLDLFGAGPEKTGLIATLYSIAGGTSGGTHVHFMFHGKYKMYVLNKMNQFSSKIK